MAFNKEQMVALSAYEGYFETAVKASWSRNPGRDALKEIHAIFTSATGDQRRFNDNCSTCILNLLKDCGKVYFASKADEMVSDTKKVARKTKKNAVRSDK